MLQGQNVKLRVWNMVQQSDDRVGGAVFSGTVRYQSIDARFEDVRPSQLLYDQGLETVKLYDIMLQPQGALIYERDEVEIINPVSHPLVNQRLRIVGVQRDSIELSDGRGHMELRVTQTEKSRSLPGAQQG